MPTYDELIHISATVESEKLAAEAVAKKTAVDYFALAVATVGVGYLPLAPGTYGSLVGVLIYLAVEWFEVAATVSLSQINWRPEQINALLHAANLLVFLPFCVLGIWAASRSTHLFQKKDPQEAVIDEVMGQLIVFLFVPFQLSWPLVLAGFLLFRLFDIWKPYPINSLQNLPTGLGVCADDILAGIYGGVCLSLLYAVSTVWF